MEAKLLKKLTDDFPDFFRLAYKYNNFNIYCGDGWFFLIYELMETLVEKNIKNFFVHTIKEKFGGLRIYFGLINSEFFESNNSCENYNKVREIVNFYEYISQDVCEKCGGYGEIYPSYHLQSLCCDCRIEDIYDEFDDEEN